VILDNSHNAFSQLLTEQGRYVIRVDGVDWYNYSGFMVPAYLPHCCPTITQETALNVLRESGRPFVRWDSQFGKAKGGEWWYVIRKGTWSLRQCSANTRSKIRRGCKWLYARPLTVEEVLQTGYDVCIKAEKRHAITGSVLSRELYERKIQAAASVVGTLEFFGVFSGDKLVAYSENYIQNKAAFWESIWYDPEFLPKYSSYVLVDAMLNYYLNERKFVYVSDGSRSIYHRTQVQNFLMTVFGFTKEYAILSVLYAGMFKAVVNMVYPFRYIVWFVSDRCSSDLIDRAGAVLRQEYIRKACKLL